MARVLDILQEEPRACSYLPDREASLFHRILVEVSPLELEAMLERGWRRFGPDYFRPVCESCSACVPTRIPTGTFTPSKSQRRARNACSELTARVGAPVFDQERLALYHRWHAFREAARGWDEASLSERTYRIQFAFPHPAARELTYYDEAGRLVGVGLCDETPRAWSAIYFFYDPDWAKRSIGTANVLFQLELAARRGIPYVYLGYQVEGCRSLAYKASFLPQEQLVGYPDENEEPVWKVVTRS
ncbi:MAG: arginyltransferase [Myxococcales bacterium]|nr:arginyltransferase [Myxococcales bacterium]